MKRELERVYRAWPPKPAEKVCCIAACSVTAARSKPDWRWDAEVGLEMNEAALVSYGDRFGAADRIKLGENRLHVGLGRALGDRQPSRDVLVATPLGHQLQHIELALREARLRFAMRCNALAATVEEV